MSSESSLPLDQSLALLSSFNSFLTVAIHNILYYRAIYPPTTFLSARAYNLPVHQNRHPKVCAWVRDAVDAVAVQLAGGHVARIAVVLHAPLHPTTTTTTTNSSPTSPSPPPPPAGSVLERWLFDTSRFPAWPGGAKPMQDYERMLAKEARSEEGRDGPSRAGAPDPSVNVSWPDVDEQLRGALRRMAHAAENLAPLPEGCTFTVAVELREQGAAPIGHPQAWIPSEPNLQPAANDSKSALGKDVSGAKTTPIRSVEAGPLFFECWVEEGKAKAAFSDWSQSQETTGTSP
ncbi:DNA-binding protein [Podospora appendiculata]|uniref:DNA-binding protein n=1 Tax=Podospora appendiculata TaxID=314037 RepID=A0AAE1CBN7_9PEZI|nr:DNA-binding protein [Podospora appendiculata]